MKTYLAVGVAIATTLLTTPAQADNLATARAACWLLRGEGVTAQQICTYEASLWTGGGGIALIWRDGSRSKIIWGEPQQGGPACAEVSLDGVCGFRYFRDFKTLRRLSDPEGLARLRNGELVVRCVQARRDSACWL